MESLLSLYQDEWTGQCLSVASYTCLVYDHALTLDKEVEFIWQAPWTFTKAVFLLNRYGNLICQTAILFAKLVGVPNDSTEYCILPNIFMSMYVISSVESIHILVLLRAWAIWGCQRRVAVILISSYFIYLSLFIIKATFSTMSVSIRTFKYADLPEICVTVIPPKSWILALANACQDTIVFATTLASLWRHSRSTQILYPTSLLFVLVRDAIIFYTSSIFFDIFNAVTWLVYPSNPKNVLFITFALNLLSIAGQRLVLNLRGLTVQTYGSRSISAEVERQLQMLSGAQWPDLWNPTTSQPNNFDIGNRRKTNEDIEMDVLNHGLTKPFEQRD